MHLLSIETYLNFSGGEAVEGGCAAATAASAGAIAAAAVPCQIRPAKLNIYLSFNINVGTRWDNRQFKLLTITLRVAAAAACGSSRIPNEDL